MRFTVDMSLLYAHLTSATDGRRMYPPRSRLKSGIPPEGSAGMVLSTYVAEKDAAGRRGARGSAELDYGEFCEIACRLCRQKLAGSEASGAAGMPFEQTLDTWLGLVFIPSLRNAGKGLLVEPSRAPTR